MGSAGRGWQWGPTHKAGDVSPRGLPRPVPFCWLPPREGEATAGVIQRLLVVGKPSTRSSSGMPGSISFLDHWFVWAVASDRFNCPFPILPQRAHFHPLLCPAWIKSSFPRLLNRVANMAPGRPVLKLLSMYALASDLNRKPLTIDNSAVYASMLKGRFSCDESAGKTSGSVPGTLDNQGRALGS